MEAWWRRFPEKWEEEQSALKRASIRYRVLEKDESRGALTLEIGYVRANEPLRLVATYPREYPYFPVSVDAPDVNLPRHQHPLSKNLCLLAKPHEDWSITDTLAGLIVRQLPQLFQSAADPAGSGAEVAEVHQGEPWTDYVSYLDGAQLVVADIEIPPHCSKGKLKCAVDTASPLRAVVIEVSDEHGSIIATPPKHWLKKCTNWPVIHGDWTRLPANPPIGSPKAHFALVNRPFSERPQTMSKLPFRVSATIFQEEMQWRARKDGWLVSAWDGHKRVFFWQRVAYGAQGDLHHRAPELTVLSKKKVLLVGLGMLGAHCAIQLARAGIEQLSLVDWDHVEFGTTVRWALGYEASGFRKPDALARYIRENYPFCAVVPIEHRLGQPLINPGQLVQAKAFDRALEAADLVVDAAAEHCVSNFLSLRCIELAKPHIWLTATPGMWGGIIGRYLPHRTGCWACMKRFQDQPGGFPQSPHARIETGVQPNGCRSPTATGAGFDSDQIAIGGVRLTVATLCASHANAYPDLGWDVATVNLRDGNGQPVLPTWRGFQLRKHELCDHGGDSARMA